MLDATDKMLAQANYDTKVLSVIDDTTLGRGDLDKIASTIRQCPSLERVVVARCRLSSASLKPIVKAITDNPSITAVDFSGNGFDDLDVLIPLVGRYQAPNPHENYYDTYEHRHINELNIEGTAATLKGKMCRKFMNAMIESDHIAVLKASFDPWDFESFTTGFKDVFVKAANAIKWSFVIEKRTDYGFAENISAAGKQQILTEKINANYDGAQHVLHRIENAQVLSTDDVNNLNNRYAAVLYLAQQKYGHEKAEEVLKEFHGKAKAATGLETDLFSYIEKKPQAAVPVKTTFAPAAASSQDVRAVIENLSVMNADSARQMIESFRSTPSQVIKIGEATLEAYSKIAASSLTYVTALPTTHAAEGILADFKLVMNEVVGVVEKMAGRTLEGAGLPVPADVPRGFFGGLFNSVPPQPSFDLLKPKAERTAVLLRTMVPQLAEIKTQNARLLDTNTTMMDAYATITDRLDVFIAASCGIMRDERQATTGQPRSMFAAALEDRGRLLDQENQRIKQEAVAHQARSSFMQQQDTKLLLAQRALTLLGASVEGFVKQVYQANGSATDTTSAMGKVKEIVDQTQRLETELTNLGQLYEAERRNANEVFFKKPVFAAAPTG